MTVLTGLREELERSVDSSTAIREATKALNGAIDAVRQRLKSVMEAAAGADAAREDVDNPPLPADDPAPHYPSLDLGETDD